jgi:hypothetical protein
MRARISRRMATIALHGPATRFSEFAYRLRGWWAVPYRLAYYFVGSWLHRREPAPVQRVRLSGDAPCGLLLSTLLMSCSVCDIDVEFGSASADPGLPGDLSHHAFDHNVNRYLKTAHPGAFIVAVSLATDADGFCDGAFATWREALAALAAEFPRAALIVLNPVGPELCRREFIGRRGPLFSAALAGLSHAETLRLAQTADVFLDLGAAQSPPAAIQQLRLKMSS